jgi:hypothetical protein
MAERELSDQRVEALEAELPAPLLVLSEPSSRRPSARPCATTSAAPGRLAADPLLRSRLATQAPGGAPATAATLRAAERLGLPLSTYRYHLAGGLRRVTERLWRAELYGPDD